MTNCEFLKNIQDNAREGGLPLEPIKRFEATNCKRCNGTRCFNEFSTERVEDLLPVLDGNELNRVITVEQLKREKKQVEVENQGLIQVEKFLRKDKERVKILWSEKFAV